METLFGEKNGHPSKNMETFFFEKHRDTLWVHITEIISFAFQGCFQVRHAFHSGGNRWGHIDGGATENDVCCTCVPDISVFLWGEFSAYIVQIIIQVTWNKTSGLFLDSQLFLCKGWKCIRAVTAPVPFSLQIVCIWGAGGATPGKFLIGLRVVTCDSSVLVQPNRVLVVPATNVSLSAWVVKSKSYLATVS